MTEIQIPADATLWQLSNLLAEFGSNAANAEYDVRIAEANWLSHKQHADEWLLLATADIDAKSETAKRARALKDNPDLRAAISKADNAEYELLFKKGERDRYRMAYEAVSRIVAVKQMEHDVNVRMR